MQFIEHVTALAAITLFAGCSSSIGQYAEDSFQNFEGVAASVRGAKSLSLYEGLPNNYWESDAYKAELAAKETKQIDDWHFYAEPVSTSPEIVEKLRSATSNRSLFTPYDGPKACGGLHSDWCLMWIDGNVSRRIHLCFGCNEMLAFGDDEQLIRCDIADLEQFKSILKLLRTHRPPESRR